jgi:hypothetical protein
MWVACAAMMQVSREMQSQDSDISTQCNDWVSLPAYIAGKDTQ